ncbi:abscisic acid 8'-hydroxylase CYP707A1-like [Impatiens glandulifera]|uniref:abscisic acid 8'-hydroxylase CYP707A1-like n=1 Tax=Impatiens glandulifera TaxID=253017 RepID=UPI001FB05690|nr:abscisic acid 8'-hydroxylase CYP707A1-like [Impatiens glandulifera]
MEKVSTTLVSFLLFLLDLVLEIILIKKKRKVVEPTNDHVKRTSLDLPPGSMGLPYIGETLQLYTRDPNIFFASKQQKYGEIFKTRILGCPCVMLASPESSRFVLVTQAHLFKPTYPKSKMNLIGPSALFFHQGEYHLRLRKLIQYSLSPDTVRNSVTRIASLTNSVLDSWTGLSVVDTFQEMKKLSFEVGILTIFGDLADRYRNELKKNYSILNKGYNSFPTNLPGTPYRKALSARKRLNKILIEIIEERKENKSCSNGKNLLGFLLDSKYDLKEDQIADNIIGVLFAAQDTTATLMTWIVKYLHDHPKLLKAVTDEQVAILKSNNGCENDGLTWAQTRNMDISNKVVLESLRMASIISFTFREAVADVEYKGYLIPKGWKVMPLFRNIHHNPDFFTNPKSFDHSRFENAPKPYTFMPFGAGVHACPGNELAKVEMLIMIHHLVTKFRWEVVGTQSGVQYSPFPIPLQGLPARFWKRESSAT